MIIGVGWEQLPLIKKAKEMGLETITTTWWKKERLNADKVFEVDSRDLTTLERIFIEEQVDAVIADECDYSMYAVAYFTDKYNLPGPSLYPLTITTNKYLQRKEISDIDIKQPDFKLCWNFDMVEQASEKFGFPLVIKPLDNRGSIGVSITHNEEELKDAWFSAIKNSHSRLCIAEQYINGDIITFEGFHDSENYHFLCISTKENYENTTTVAKKLYYPGKIYDSDFLNKISEYGKDIVNKIKINFGFTHIEFIIEKDSKKPYFIEIANRGGGVHISNKILYEIIGINFTEKLIRMSMGEKINIEWDGNYISKVLMFFLNPTGKKNPEDLINKYNESLLALYMKPAHLISKGTTKDALGRAGVALIKGQNFEELHKIGIEIENQICAKKKEYYWGGK